MLTSVQYLSLSDALQLPPAPNRAILSIGAPGEAKPELPASFRLERVEFDDLAEDWLGLTPAKLPYENADGRSSEWHGFRLPMLADAKKIVQFVGSLHAEPTPIDLVVHCHSGISRSVAVAHFVAETYHVPLLTTARDVNLSNPRLRRLLTQVGNESH